jgi:hypothetical protein
MTLCSGLATARAGRTRGRPGRARFPAELRRRRLRQKLVGNCFHRRSKEVRAKTAESWLYCGMNIQVAVLCDAATNDNEKLNLLGAFDTIYAQQLPAVHPQCSVALRLTFTAGDEGHHQLTLNFVNADGRTIMPPMDLPVSISLPDDAHFLTRNFIVNIQQLKFNEAGRFSLDIQLDGQSQASIPLLVKHMPPPPGGVPGMA